MQQDIEKMNQEFGKVNGLYHKWYQDNTLNSYLIEVLYALYMEPGITQKRISENYHLPKQTVNNVILSLKKEHYIELVPDKDDKRVKKIELTVTGKTYTNQQLQPFLQLDENIYQTMGESDYRLLISLLVKYGNALEHEF